MVQGKAGTLTRGLGPRSLCVRGGLGSHVCGGEGVAKGRLQLGNVKLQDGLRAAGTSRAQKGECWGGGIGRASGNAAQPIIAWRRLGTSSGAGGFGLAGNRLAEGGEWPSGLSNTLFAALTPVTASDNRCVR